MGTLAISASIIARLAAGMPTIPIMSETQIGIEQPPPIPAVYVESAGEEVRPDPAGRGRQMCASTWAVVVRVSHIDDGGESAALRADAIVDDVNRLLIGWSPADQFERLSYAGMAAPFYNYHGGYSDFPLMFITQTVVSARN